MQGDSGGALNPFEVTGFDRVAVIDIPSVAGRSGFDQLDHRVGVKIITGLLTDHDGDQFMVGRPEGGRVGGEGESRWGAINFNAEGVG